MGPRRRYCVVIPGLVLAAGGTTAFTVDLSADGSGPAPCEGSAVLLVGAQWVGLQAGVLAPLTLEVQSPGRSWCRVGAPAPAQPFGAPCSWSTLNGRFVVDALAVANFTADLELTFEEEGAP